VALGILEICKLQKRDMYVIHFSSNRKDQLKCHFFDKKMIGHVDEIIAMANYFEGGGTAFEPPLSLAMDKINLDPKFSKADIIFITDGESVVSDKFLQDYKQWKKDKNVTTAGVLINSSYNSDASLKEICNSYVKSSDMARFADDATALDLFRNL